MNRWQKKDTKTYESNTNLTLIANQHISKILFFSTFVHREGTYAEGTNAPEAT